MWMNYIRRHRWDAALLPNGTVPSVTTLRGVLFMLDRFDKTFSLIPCPPFVSTKLDFTKTCHKKGRFAGGVFCYRKPFSSFLYQKTSASIAPISATRRGHRPVDRHPTPLQLTLGQYRPCVGLSSLPWPVHLWAGKRRNRSDRRPHLGVGLARYE